MKGVFFLLLAFSSSVLVAQRQFVGGLVGFNPSFVSGQSISEGLGRAGFQAGITYMFVGEDDLLFEIGGVYQQRGFKEKQQQTEEIITHRLDYIAYPIKLGVFVKGTKNGYAAFKGGLVPALLVEASNSVGQTVIESRPLVWDIAAAIDCSLGYIFKDKLDVYINVGFQQSFLMTQPNFLPNRRLLTGSVNTSIGCRYRIPY